MDEIMQLPKIKELTEDVNTVIDSIKDSKLCAINEDNTAIKPIIKTQRNTIILRDIPSETTEDLVKAIFQDCPGTIANVRSDVGDTW